MANSNLTFRIASRTSFRAIDLFGTQALARWPSLFIALLLMPDALRRFSGQLMQAVGNPQAKTNFDPMDVAISILVLIACIPFLCWMVYLMYKAYSVSCNIKGGKAIGTFIAGLLVASVLSRLCLVLVVFAAAPTALSASQANAPAMVALQKSGEQFADLLAKGDFQAAVAQFDSAMKKALPESDLRKVWQDVQKQYGPFQKPLKSRVAKQMGYRIVFVTCQFERASLDMKIVYDSNDQITGLFFIN